jgi:hypothetical protein
MKKSQLLIAMAMMTVMGVVVTGAGVLSLADQSTGFSLGQALGQLWNLHPAFGWTMGFYCVFMVLADLWVVAGALLKSSSSKAETITQ